MYGYIRQGRRTELTRELIGGVPFQVLTVGTGPLRRVRARRLLRRLARQGVSAAVFEDGAWREAAARYGIRRCRWGRCGWPSWESCWTPCVRRSAERPRGCAPGRTAARRGGRRGCW